MKHKLSILAILLMALTFSQRVMAYDFTYTHQGKTLYYSIANNYLHQVHVVYPSTGNSNYVIGDVVIPDSVEYNNATYAVTAISSGAFSSCNTLTSVIIPNTVTIIYDQAFASCGNLSSIIIPDSVYSIGSDVFINCNGLPSVTIGNSVNSIGTRAFGYCSQLNIVNFNADSCITMGSSTYPVFSGCYALSTLNIGNNVKRIPAYAFDGCGGLSSLTLPSSVIQIGANAFRNCSGLTEIISHATTAPLISTANPSFNGVSSTIPIHIPCGSLMSYYSRWSYFSNYIEATGYSFSATSDNNTMGVVDVLTAPTCQTPIAVFNASANVGYTFDHWNDGNTDNPRTLTLTSDTSIVGYFTIQSNDTVFYHDTTYINVHDTTVVHDTTYFPLYIHDTITQHDTVLLNVTIHDTIIAYVNIPVHDTIYAYIEVPVHDTIYLPQYIHDTVWLHDTVYVTQTGIDDKGILTAKIYQRNGQVVVEGVDGNTVTLFDVNGRVLATKQDFGTTIIFDTLASGTYMIKIGAYPARKVVVIR